MRARRIWLLLALLGAGCGDDTTLQRITFHARAGGVERASGGPLTLRTALGWDVTLTAAQVSVASMYFRNAPPDDGPVPYDGRAVAEALDAFVVDALDARARDVGTGRGTTSPAMVGEVRFGPATSGPIGRGGIYAVAYVAGTAARGDVTVAFDGVIKLGNDPSRSDYQSASDRRLSRLAASFTASEGGTLTVRVDPARWFDQVAFETLGSTGADARDFDTPADALRFRNGLAAASGAFRFVWDAPR